MLGPCTHGPKIFKSFAATLRLNSTVTIVERSTIGNAATVNVPTNSKQALHGTWQSPKEKGDKNKGLLAAAASSKKRKTAEDRSLYASWSLMVDNAYDLCDDGMSEAGASTIANMDEAAGAKLGFVLWGASESAQDMFRRWTVQILDGQEAMLVLPFLKVEWLH